MKFKKKPLYIEAWQLGDDADELHRWAETVGFVNWSIGRDGTIEIETLEGTMTASPGDWIIKGIAGEFYPCKPAIFNASYERVYG